MVMTAAAPANATMQTNQEDLGINNTSNLPENDVGEIKAETRESPAHSSTEAEEELADHGTTSCPLFMDSLPRNFESNAGLSAIASLLNEDSGNDNTESEKSSRTSEIKVITGGGKATKRRTGMGRHSPYKSPNGKSDAKKGTTIGEAQLFLSMWKM
ncbi:hypothetical protein ACHAWO_013075 [Cyclotella atomus]|jgi:hypothetical protein|uniref:Uncharacterized protein n=1 Tax=Cyclotella atomus TaxID=382360 RepID=A0ABD3NPC6_9STRA